MTLYIHRTPRILSLYSCKITTIQVVNWSNSIVAPFRYICDPKRQLGKYLMIWLQISKQSKNEQRIIDLAIHFVINSTVVPLSWKRNWLETNRAYLYIFFVSSPKSYKHLSVTVKMWGGDRSSPWPFLSTYT